MDTRRGAAREARGPWAGASGRWARARAPSCRRPPGRRRARAYPRGAAARPGGRGRCRRRRRSRPGCSGCGATRVHGPRGGPRTRGSRTSAGGEGRAGGGGGLAARVLEPETCRRAAAGGGLAARVLDHDGLPSGGWTVLACRSCCRRPGRWCRDRFDRGGGGRRGGDADGGHGGERQAGKDAVGSALRHVSSLGERGNGWRRDRGGGGDTRSAHVSPRAPATSLPASRPTSKEEP